MEEEQEETKQVGIVLSGAIAIGTAVGCGIVMLVSLVMLSILTSL